MNQGLTIQHAAFNDIESINQLSIASFQTHAEANLVNLIRSHIDNHISLVAKINGQLVGHIMLSPTTLTQNKDLINKECIPSANALAVNSLQADIQPTILPIKIMAIAPLTVQPQCRNAGIGTALVKTAIEECKLSGIDAIMQLGEPEYYRRFGFVQSWQHFNIRNPYEIPAAYFQILPLTDAITTLPNTTENRIYTATYHSIFNTLNLKKIR